VNVSLGESKETRKIEILVVVSTFIYKGKVDIWWEYVNNFKGI